MKPSIHSSYKLASSGYSLIIPAVAQGLSQKDLVNLKDLENDVLQLSDKLIPPKTSFNGSAEGGADNEGGRPPKSVDEKKD
jgi:hypothetical protein